MKMERSSQVKSAYLVSDACLSLALTSFLFILMPASETMPATLEAASFISSSVFLSGIKAARLDRMRPPGGPSGKGGAAASSASSTFLAVRVFFILTEARTGSAAREATNLISRSVFSSRIRAGLRFALDNSGGGVATSSSSSESWSESFSASPTFFVTVFKRLSSSSSGSSGPRGVTRPASPLGSPPNNGCLFLCGSE